MRIETIAVHAGGSPDAATGSVAPPIHLSTTFEHGPESEKLHGFMYIRDGHPGEARLEPALAAIEGGEAALVFSSGMAAGAAALQSLPSDSHVLFADDIYYAVRDIAKDFLPRWGIESSVVNMADLTAVERSIRKNTRLLWAESPSNPLLNVVDLAALARLARAAGAEFLVDGTFATPVLQRPIALGAGVVLHSATKYFGGHSDVQGGALVFARRGEAYEKCMHIRHILGGVLSPFNTWLVLRGLRTLPCRVERQSENALVIARALENHPAVETVHYPGLASHPAHEIAKRQMKAFGGMLSLRIRGGRERAIAVAARAKLFTNATSLGGVESTLEHRASSEGSGSTTPPNLLRVSVGLEHAQDLIDDLLQALES